MSGTLHVSHQVLEILINFRRKTSPRSPPGYEVQGSWRTYGVHIGGRGRLGAVRSIIPILVL